MPSRACQRLSVTLRLPRFSVSRLSMSSVAVRLTLPAVTGNATFAGTFTPWARRLSAAGPVVVSVALPWEAARAASITAVVI